jgi:hypothetical protein
VDAALLARPEPFEVRRPKQPQFHAFPTSTIGSFPQTAEVRGCPCGGVCCVGFCGVVSVCVCLSAGHLGRALCSWSLGLSTVPYHPVPYAPQGCLAWFHATPPLVTVKG